MASPYAQEFSDIPRALAENETLRNAVLALIDREPMPGKVTEGGDRLTRVRAILRDLVEGRIGLTQAYRRVDAELPRQASIYAGDNRVFAANWQERLIRTQFSRFYNQAVMEELIGREETRCYVPHSEAEAADSPCSRQLAGAHHDVNTLHRRLVESYGQGNWTQAVKIPNHPHCTHVVAPPQ